MQDFDAIYKVYAPAIYRLCLGYAGEQEMAKDLLQETFISVFSALPGFRGESKISTWIYRIASNKCLRAVEIAGRMPKAEMPVDFPDHEDSSPLEEKHLILLRCISSLKESERLIVSLELEGIPQAEIAAIAGLSEVNVRVKLFRIKDKLKPMLLRYEQFR